MEYKILVVDDNEDDLYFFKRAIKDSELKCNLSTASDGHEGLEVLKKERFDFVFLDYYLPGMDGIEILKEIRGLGIQTPIIMLTGQQDENAVKMLIMEGATDFLSKNSLSPESLRLSIENSHRKDKRC